MAASSALCNLFSFLSLTKPSQPKIPPTQLSILQTQKPRDGLVPLPAQGAHSAAAASSIESVICPSLAHASVLFFKSAYNVQVIVDDNEPEERLLGRFPREVMRAGVIQEVKRRRYFENNQDEKKRRTRDAAKRNKRSRRPFSKPFQPEIPETKKSDDDGDNWDLPQGDIPY
ncbi:hypothetical protein D8674_036411 [Pyrus ussuriensis x Pyrus communis]|uniref:30S ribosomal protein S21 n=1 Tax=Pyrus ussuriensis x Pyrus communis TaxID=2448454 RepID=A0A5N5GF23_9ROSA|nr:30S ribosomal protein S21, chloroplastic [Pyrus x bretschneideri]KAB2614095.1 hypothetical protein D8674_036411 [Pyrus ussuriensis x Pyrus communis]